MRSHNSSLPFWAKSANTASTASKDVPEIIPITRTVATSSPVAVACSRASSLSGPGVDGVAKPVAKEVETNHGEDDRYRREGQCPPGELSQAAGLVDHLPE